MIIKDPKIRKQTKRGLYRFGVCYDDSQNSKDCLAWVVRMLGNNDRLVLMTVDEVTLNKETYARHASAIIE